MNLPTSPKELSMKPYAVEWEIEVDADSPEDAARRAQEIQRDPESIATVFTVHEIASGKERVYVRSVDIDLASPAPDLIDDVEMLPEMLGEHMNDDGTDHDNRLRAGLAATAVKAFARRCGGGGEDAATMISDLIGDLMHLCAQLELEYGELADKGAFHYTAERDETD